MKVYVVILNFIDVDSNWFETSVVGVFNEKKSALKAMAEEFKNVKKEFECYDIDEEENETNCSVWEKGEYPSHHCDLLVQERKIQ